MSFPLFPPIPNPESSNTSKTNSQPSLEQSYEISTETREPSFICTICWQSQPCGSKPKLLGTSARIVCKDCWRAVLDLSICWVCGECIVRGDEVVSLGWCFWHRNCFGCLVCGLSIPIPSSGVEVEGVGGNGETDGDGWRGFWGAWEYEGEGRRRCVGVELSTIPLCSVCVVETEGESRGEVLRRGLDTVSRFDGGLSRERLKMFSEDGGELRVAAQRRLQSPRRSRARTCEMGLNARRNSCACPVVEEDRLPLLKNAAAMGISNEDENPEPEAHYHSDSETAKLSQIEAKPEVYVSVFDPINELPSKTKPLPEWMNLFPDEPYKEKKRRKTEPQYHSSTLVRETTWLGAGAHFISGDNSFDDSETATRKNSERPITPPLTSYPRELTSEIDQEERKGSTEEPVRNRKRKSSSISFHPKITRDCILVEPDEKVHRHSKIIEIAASPGISTALPPRERTPYPSIEKTEARMPPDYFARGAIAPLSPTECSDEAARKRRSTAPSPELAPELVGKWTITPSPEESSSPAGVVSPVPITKIQAPLLAKSTAYLDTYNPDSPDPKIDRDMRTPPEEDLQNIKEERTRMLDKECWEEKVRGREQIRRGMRCEGLERREVDREELYSRLRTLLERKADVGRRGVVREEWNKL